jgi:hypothetical protein
MTTHDQILFGDRDGDTFDAPVDRTPLNAQMIRVYGALALLALGLDEPGWFSLSDLADLTGDPEASVSARLRDFRKKRFGGHTVDRRRDGRLYLYRLTWNDDVTRPTDPEIGEAYYGKVAP